MEVRDSGDVVESRRRYLEGGDLLERLDGNPQLPPRRGETKRGVDWSGQQGGNHALHWAVGTHLRCCGCSFFLRPPNPEYRAAV